MVDAILKLSWRGSGGSLECIGGIAGSCFTVESKTVSCGHFVNAELFSPHHGYDECRVYVLGQNTAIPLSGSNIESIPDFDLVIIHEYRSDHPYILSSTHLADLPAVGLSGFFANDPFPLQMGAHGPEPIASASPPRRQLIQAGPGTKRRLDVKARDMIIPETNAFLWQVDAAIGLSGGAVLNPVDGTAAGLCFLGLPEDADRKDQIVAFALRDIIADFK